MAVNCEDQMDTLASFDAGALGLQQVVAIQVNRRIASSFQMLIASFSVDVFIDRDVSTPYRECIPVTGICPAGHEISEVIRPSRPWSEVRVYLDPYIRRGDGYTLRAFVGELYTDVILSGFAVL